MSPNIGVSFWARACWLCPLLCPLCSARLPGHWAWHIRTAALLVPSFIRTITESKPAETTLSRDWALLGLTGPRSDQASRIGSSSSLTSTCYDLWTDSKTAPDLIWADSPPWKLPLVWLLLPGTKRAGSGCTQAGESSSKGSVRRGGEKADSHAPGADGTLFYVWPQWIMSAKLLEAYNMEISQKNIVNQNSKIH